MMSYLTAWIPAKRLPKLARALRAAGFDVTGRGLADYGANGAYVANLLNKLNHDPIAARIVRGFLLDMTA
jgi:hypothetical protein